MPGGTLDWAYPPFDVLPHLSERMLARFTQLDYDRELALVAVWDDEFVAVGYEALVGRILEANHDMLQLARHLRFAEQGREGNEVMVARTLK